MGDGTSSWTHAGALLAYAVGFGLLAVLAYKRDEGRQFRLSREERHAYCDSGWEWTGRDTSRSRLSRARDDVLVLSRSPRPAPWRTAQWDGATAGPWARELDGAHVVINMAGRSVNCRYTPANRAEIISSRVNSIKAIADAIARTTTPPRIWLQAATATIYAHRHDAPNDERTGRIDRGEQIPQSTWRFSIDVATAWEEALDQAGCSAHAESCAAIGDGDESGRRRCLCHTARPRSRWPWRRQR